MDSYYDAIAPRYNELHGEEQKKKYLEFLHALPKVPRGKLLDVGCGTALSREFFSECDWQGIEPSQGLIDQAKEHVRKNIILGRGEELPFDDDEFDIVLSVTALQNFENSRQGLEEIRRVLSSEGVALLSVLRKSSKSEQISQEIRELFRVEKEWKEEKDLLFVLRIREVGK
jgi:ubiquinone/menaquinone biosynthesis C-methylase UbiE